jgi:hypothetical protein
MKRDFKPLEDVLQEFGYKLEKIMRFKNVDRIKVSKPQFFLTVSLRKHVEDLPLLQILEGILTSNEYEKAKEILGVDKE